MKTSKAQLLRSTLLAALAVPGVAVPAFAQEGPAAQGDVVVVTGTRITQPGVESSSQIASVGEASSEVALYRLWPDKQAMFVAAIGFVGDNTERIWNELARKAGPGSAAERVLRHEATHLGEFGFHRILFAGFSETDDPAIRRALRDVYERLLGRIAAFVGAHRRGTAASKLPANTLTAWALLGLGTATNLGRELGMLDDRARKQLFATIGAHLLG